MGCGSSKGQRTPGGTSHGCCSCMGCCIAPPQKAVLYDDIDGQDEDTQVLARPVKSTDMAECQESQFSEASSLKPLLIRDLPCLPSSRGAIGQQGQEGGPIRSCTLPKWSGSAAHNGSDRAGTGSDTDTACENGPEAKEAPRPPLGPSASASAPPHAPVGLCVPASRSMPPIPGLAFCMSVGMNARSLKTLRAHLNAKGFGPVERQGTGPADVPDPTASSATAGHTAGRWQSSHSMHSCCSPHANNIGLPDLASTSWAPLFDATSQHEGSPHGSNPSSDDAWRDIAIPDDMSSRSGACSEDDTDVLGAPHAVEGGSEDGQSMASFRTALSRSTLPFRRVRSIPASRTTSTAVGVDTDIAQPCSPPPQAHASTPHSGRSRHMGTAPGSKSWAANVHLAQANVAAEDLAHARGGDTHPALEAFIRGRLSFAFSGGGFFFPYHLGCVIQLKDMGIISDTTPLAGASCGSIIIACVNSGLDLHKLVDRLLEFAADCRDYGTAGRLKDVIVKFMTANLPPDAHHRCKKRTYISLTKVFPYLHPYIISDYTSKEDLVHAIATSCHIPAYNDGSFMARFRNHWFVDGGLVRHIPALPTDVGAAYVAGVSCVPFKFLESLPGVSRLQLLHSLAVSPDMFGTFPFQWHEVGGLVLAPAEDPVLLRMVEMGKRDIQSWASAVGLTAHLAGTRIIPPALTTTPSGGADATTDTTRATQRRRHMPRVTIPVNGDRADSGPASWMSSGRLGSRSAVSPIAVPTPTRLQPGGLPAAVEDDWHDAVEEQSFQPPHQYPHDAAGVATTVVSPPGSFVSVLSGAASGLQVGGLPSRASSVVSGTPAAAGAWRVPRRQSYEDAGEAAREGLVAAAGAVAGPLHMDPQQAVDALAGTSTLGLAQAAAATAASQELGGMDLRIGSEQTATQLRGASLDLPGGRQRVGTGLQVLHVTGGKWRGAPAGTSAQAAALSVGTGLQAVPTTAPGTARLASAPPGPGLQSCSVDIDVDALSASQSGNGEGHTVQVTAMVNGQPVLLELRLHMGGLASAQPVQP